MGYEEEMERGWEGLSVVQYQVFLLHLGHAGNLSCLCYHQPSSTYRYRATKFTAQVQASNATLPNETNHNTQHSIA